jgi:tRNA pseudouridine38-40 synthase
VRAFRIAYDGRAFRGFQRQPDVRTVEDTIFAALSDLDVAPGSEDAGDAGTSWTPPGYAAAGRTDAGVSALAQTVAFEAPSWLTPAALNSELPAAVRAWASADTPADFHATHDARSRTYEYHLHAPGAPDARVSEALELLAGTHDFANLTTDDTGTVRTLSTDWRRAGDFLVIQVTADGFPRHLVRRIAGLLGEVASGSADSERVERVLDPEPLPGPKGVATAPPEPLLLRAVEYDISFSVDEAAAASAQSVFEERVVDHRTNARIAGAVRSGIGGADSPTE